MVCLAATFVQAQSSEGNLVLPRSHTPEQFIATSAELQQLAEGLFTLEAAKLLVRKRCFTEFTKVLPAKAAARFTQVGIHVDREIDAKIASDIPIINVK